MASQAGMGFPRSNESDGAAGRSLAERNNDANLPTQFVEPAPERTPNAAGTDDGQGLFHLVLA